MNHEGHGTSTRFSSPGAALGLAIFLMIWSRGLNMYHGGALGGTGWQSLGAGFKVSTGCSFAIHACHKRFMILLAST